MNANTLIFTPETLAARRGLFNAHIAELYKEQKSLCTELQIAERADLDQDKRFAFALARLRQIDPEKTKVQLALDRIDAGTYGICEECDQSIPGIRLNAQPFARCCIECQECQDSGIASIQPTMLKEATARSTPLLFVSA